MSFSQPKRIEDALRTLAEDKWSILCGGTDFFPAVSNGPIAGNVLDISRIKELKNITQCEDHWEIGALVTWSDLIARELPPAFDALKLAGKEVGSVQIQNRASIVGNICNASPAADGVPPLLCLDAQVRLSSKRGERILSLNEFVTGNRLIDLADDEMVTHILIPKASCQGVSSFLKLGSRKYLVISIAMVAARLNCDDRGLIEDAAVSVGSCSVVARRLETLEKALVGKSLTGEIGAMVQVEHLEALSPIDDVRASAGYRREAGAELVQRALQNLVNVQ